MNVAVLGSTGLLGQAVMRSAARRGLRATGIARHRAPVSVDATNAADLCRALDSIAPDVVINAAADVNLAGCERDPGAAYLVNAGVAATLADYCGVNGIWLCHVSTDHYFTGDADRLHAEHEPVRLLNEYARTKYAGEALALTCATSLVVRTNIVGFRGWRAQPTFVEWAIAALKSGDAITLFDDFYTSSIDVPAFSEALFDLLERGATGVLNVAGRTASSKAQFVVALARRLELPAAQCRIGSVRTLDGARRAESLGLDVTLAERALGYALPDAASVIQSLAEQYRSQSHGL